MPAKRKAASSFAGAAFGKRLKIQIGQQTGFVVQPEIAGGNPEMTLEKTRKIIDVLKPQRIGDF